MKFEDYPRAITNGMPKPLTVAQIGKKACKSWEAIKRHNNPGRMTKKNWRTFLKVLQFQVDVAIEAVEKELATLQEELKKGLDEGEKSVKP